MRLGDDISFYILNYRNIGGGGRPPVGVWVRTPDNAWWSGATASVTKYLEVGGAREACHLSVAPVTNGAFQASEGVI